MKIEGERKDISFSPASVMDEIEQNIRTILTTEVGSVPLDRDFGIDTTLLDSPTPLARARLTNVILEAIERYEPRVEVVRVDYSEKNDGRLVPSVTVRLYE